MRRPGFGGQPASARSVLETIASVTFSVAGLAFSTTVVALTLTSQQLSLRVMRSFQERRLHQVVLAVFLGTFVFSLLVLKTVRSEPTPFVPSLGVSLAMGLAIVSFALFVAFIDDIVRSLQASQVLRRITLASRVNADCPYPRGIGAEPEDPAGAGREADRRAAGPGFAVRAAAGEFLTTVDGDALVATASIHEALVRQVPAIGDFVLTGDVLARVWCEPAHIDELRERVAAAFHLGAERTVAGDVGFPIRQLADIALRGLSPSTNDATTAENAMSSLADTLVGIVGAPPTSSVRVDTHGVPRFVAAVPDLDALVRLGFDQVRRDAVGHPTVAVRLLELLAAVRAARVRSGGRCDEADRQAELLCHGVEQAAALPADAAPVRAATSGCTAPGLSPSPEPGPGHRHRAEHRARRGPGDPSAARVPASRRTDARDPSQSYVLQRDHREPPPPAAHRPDPTAPAHAAAQASVGQMHGVEGEGVLPLGLRDRLGLHVDDAPGTVEARGGERRLDRCDRVHRGRKPILRQHGCDDLDRGLHEVGAHGGSRAVLGRGQGAEQDLGSAFELVALGGVLAEEERHAIAEGHRAGLPEPRRPEPSTPPGTRSQPPRGTLRRMASAGTAVGQVRLLEADPDLAEELEPEAVAILRRHLVAPLIELAPGIWTPPAVEGDRHGHLGLLVLEGVMTRDVRIANTVRGARRIRRRPAPVGGRRRRVADRARRHVGVLFATRVAVLDRRCTAAIGRVPELTAAIVRRSVRRSRWLALHLFIRCLRRVDARLVLLFWHLAQRWGRVTPDGVVVPLRLTHEALGRLVGAQRPTVTTALGQLAERSAVANRMKAASSTRSRSSCFETTIDSADAIG